MTKPKPITVGKQSVKNSNNVEVFKYVVASYYQIQRKKKHCTYAVLLHKFIFGYRTIT